MEKKENIFTITKGTKTVIMVMTVLVLIGILIARFYYDGINKSEDPRVLNAKHLYKDYSKFVNENNYDSVFSVLDKIEQIYLAHKDYKKSYEVGVVYNNRAAVWLTLAISEKNDSLKKSYLQKAKKVTDKAIRLFNGWLDMFGKESEDKIYKMVYGYYEQGNSIYKDLDINKIINKRAESMLLAQLETPRRLSVAYTNLGTIYRHSEDYKNAMLNNKKALELWPENLTAKNNINILLGRPLEERSTLDKLFPESKDSK